MNVASLELCKELYELSGWETKKDDTNLYHIQQEGEYSVSPVVFDNCCWREYEGDEIVCPAYDLGYLLRKMPDAMHSPSYNVTYRLQMKKVESTYFFEYSNHAWFRDMKPVFTRRGFDTSDDRIAYGILPVCADTPEDAAAKLAIELFKAEILVRGDK